ncbi:hypothetical protein Sango_2124300 [Sesamum angolense]|uniref:Uncharacterized protein n=1 Tax=Sesamum angolense TaxID=2727404 RepID=A0AAE1WC30_9LAMI|nr:hypothetical protein Sango_2124300 [Sesamum angolense]
MSPSAAIRGRIFTLLLLLSVQKLPLVRSSIAPPPPPFNISHFLFPKVTAFTESGVALQAPHLLQGVLEAIANKEKWALEDIRVSELDVKKAKYGTVQTREFRVRVGKSEIVFKVYGEAPEWKKLAVLRKNGSSNFESWLGKLVLRRWLIGLRLKALSSCRESEPKISEAAKGERITTVVDWPCLFSFRFELVKDGFLSLMISETLSTYMCLIPMKFNTTHSGLRRISVGEGITVEVQGAEGISTFHPPDRHQPPYGILTYRKWNEVESIWPASCTKLLPIRILGSASVVAYRSQRSAALRTVLSSRNAIELLPDKCYLWPNYEKPRQFFSPWSLRVALKVLSSFLDEKPNPNALLRSFRARIGASTMYRFQLELERNIRSNDTYWSTLAQWRTRPIVERVWFEVVARLDGEVLKPLVIKKVRPFIDIDSISWSSLLSNLSFTKFPSILVPPEALTLDVKW